MDVADDRARADGERVAASLAAALDVLTFVDRTGDEVTTLMIETVAGWAESRGWRVYHRAPSVVPLPPPMQRQFSVLDVACARPDGPPVVVEIDHTDRRRTVDKLVAEAAAGRIAIWVRWGTGRFVAPPEPVQLVTCVVTRNAGPAGHGRLHSRRPDTDRPPPAHSAESGGQADARELPMFGPED